MFERVLEPARDAVGSSQCSGSGYILRRSALQDIGGWPLADVGEDILCSFMLIAAGWRTKFIRDELQFGLEPGSMYTLIKQKIRWVRIPSPVCMLRTTNTSISPMETYCWQKEPSEWHLDTKVIQETDKAEDSQVPWLL